MLLTLNHSELARRFLLWPVRFQEGIRDLATLGRGEQRLTTAFADYLADHGKERHDDDIQDAVRHFFQEHRTFVSWFQALLPDFPNCFLFYDREPRIREGLLGHWREITATIDPDALLTLALVRKKQENELSELRHWGAIIRGGSGDLDHILRRGLADIHVHLAGCGSVPLVWQQLVTGTSRLEALPRYSISSLTNPLKTPFDRHALQREEKNIRRAIKGRAEQLKNINLPEKSTVEQRQCSPLFPEFLKERLLLAAAWKAGLNSNPDVSAKSISFLDQYIIPKSLFLYHHQQPPSDNNPGLSRFRKYLDSVRPIRRQLGTSPRIQEKIVTKQLNLARESRFLKILEVRIAPMATVPEYERFLKVIERIVASDSWQANRARLRLSFVVHFIRKKNVDVTVSPSSPCAIQRQCLDRDSAVLHLFRKKLQTTSRFITGVDVANLERPAPPYCFLHAFQLLRGKSVSPDRLRAAGFTHWARLTERGDTTHPLHLPRLGLTYHVGEDFYHPVDGLRHMDEIVKYGGWETGDRMGHGLAAGWDIDRFHAERGRSIALPQGVLLNNLVWIYDQLQKLPSTHHNSLYDLEQAIHSLSKNIFGSPIPFQELRKLPEMRYGWDACIQNPEETTPLAVASAPSILYREWHDPEVRRALRLLAGPIHTDILKQMGNAIKEIQNQFLVRLASRGIAVEGNPTGNLATGLPDLTTHPLLRYIDIQGEKVCATLGTDDPGVFATRIEQEYELLLDAMLKNGTERQKALVILEQMRQIACEYAFNAH